MAASTKRVIVAGQGSEFTFPAASSNEEIRRMLAGSLGLPWLSNAEICTRDGGNTVEFKQPPAAAKG